MEEHPLISVIVPVYKVEEYLDRCVESIVNQTYRNLEIILVDDGSPDNCPAMCDAWAEKDERITVIHKKNGGLSDARNAGMTAASGECIALVDSDDWIADEMLERLLCAMRKDGSNIAACSVQMVWADGRKAMLISQPECVLNRAEAQLALIREDKLKHPVWYKLYRKSIAVNIPFEKGKYHEDIFWSYRAIGCAEKVSIIDYVGYYYFQRSDSIMGQQYSLKRLDAIEAKVRRQAYLESDFPELASEGRINLQFSCLYHGQKALSLPNEEKRIAISRLKQMARQYPVLCGDTKELKLTHRVWLIGGRYCLIGVCKVRTWLNIGE